MAITERFKDAWNAFVKAETDFRGYEQLGSVSYGRPPDRMQLRFSNERSIVSSIYTRIGIDVSGVGIRHISLDENGRYAKDVVSTLNECLTLEANVDQSPRAFRQDIVSTLFDKGVAAIVPVDTSVNPFDTDSYDIHTLRVGEVTTWYPNHVRVNVYNELRGLREEVTLEKRFVAIIQNPLYSVMNEPNSTLQRLIRKLNLLDSVDEQSSSGKLDLIIQLPYVIKSEARRNQAEQRRKDIEFQLKGSQYGIAYTDGTEKITQLNRPAENNLLKQVEYLTEMLYSQLGITVAVMDGTADEKTMLNYHNRTIEPILDAIVESMERTFVGRAGVKKRQRIRYFRDPFKLVPVSDLAEIADKFTRNEILTSNEIRGFMGIPPAQDPKADELVNSNMPQPQSADAIPLKEVDGMINEVFDGLSNDLNQIAGGQSGQ